MILRTSKRVFNHSLDVALLSGLLGARQASKRATPPRNQEELHQILPVPDPKVHGTRTFVSAPKISTLAPERLIKSDFISLSNKSYLTVRYRASAIVFSTYGRFPSTSTKQYHLRKFPEGTEGFVYFHSPEGVHPAAGSIRFRICARSSSPRNSFAHGQDLLLPNGSPWGLNLLRVCSARMLINVPETLVSDGLVTPELMGQLESLVDGCKDGTAYKGIAARTLDKLRFHCPVVFSFGQPFTFTLDNETTTIACVDVERRAIWRAALKTSICELPDIDIKDKTGLICLEYDADESRMMIRVLRIPKSLQGKTLYNEGEVFPLQFYHTIPSLNMAMIETLLRQSAPQES